MLQQHGLAFLTRRSPRFLIPSLLPVVFLAGSFPALIAQAPAGQNSDTSAPYQHSPLPPTAMDSGRFAADGGNAVAMSASESVAMPTSSTSRTQTRAAQATNATSATSQTPTVQTRTQSQTQAPGPVQLTDFQRLAAKTLGKPIPIFGQNLFGNPEVYAALTDTEATADYVVSTGDEVLVRVWGPVQVDARMVVDRGGNIYIPQVGQVHVAGYTYGDLGAHIREAIGQVYHGINVSVDLGHLRSIQIFVTGMAARPGTYVVSSLGTLINAVFAAGGPSPMGSLRHIQLRRGAQTISDLDLYDLINRGDKSKDVRLLPGDVIYIPPVGPQVAVGGSVKEAAIYELRGPTSVKEVLDMAGGLLNTADQAGLRVERIVDHNHRETLRLNLSSDESAPVKDGDVFTVESISPRFAQTVTIRGNLMSPGRFPWHPGMKLSEIIPDKRALLTANYWNTRNAEGNLGFQPETTATDSTPGGQFQTRTADRMSTEMQRAVGSARAENAASHTEGAPGTQPEVMTVNAGKLPAPEINWSYALIERTDATTLRNEIIPFDLGKLVLNHDMSEDRDLLPGDVVTIFSQADIRVPVDQQTRFVQIEGEVNHAGFYPIGPDDTLQSVLQRAGGVTSRSYLFGTQLNRTSDRVLQQEQLDAYIRKISLESRKSAANLMLSAGVSAGTGTALTDMENEFLQELQTQRASGRISLSIASNASSVADVPALPLEDGDSIFVPKLRPTINVMGSVYNPSLYEYTQGKNVGYYLTLAGGADRDSDPKHTFVVRANGTVISRQQDKSRFDHMQLLPGDLIVVPAKLYSLPKLKTIMDSLTTVASMGQLALIALVAARQ